MALITFEDLPSTNTPINATNLNNNFNEINNNIPEVNNSYNQSTQDTYSCDYLNDCETYSTDEVKTNKIWINGKPIYRKVIEITNTNPSASNWVEYTYTTLGLSSTIELCMFPEAYAQITQAGKLYTESFYSNGSRVQTAPADRKVNVLGNGASYNKYIIIAEYTKTTD